MSNDAYPSERYDHIHASGNTYPGGRYGDLFKLLCQLRELGSVAKCWNVPSRSGPNSSAVTSSGESSSAEAVILTLYVELSQVVVIVDGTTRRRVVENGMADVEGPYRNVDAAQEAEGSDGLRVFLYQMNRSWQSPPARFGSYRFSA